MIPLPNHIDFIICLFCNITVNTPSPTAITLECSQCQTKYRCDSIFFLPKDEAEAKGVYFWVETSYTHFKDFLMIISYEEHLSVGFYKKYNENIVSTIPDLVLQNDEVIDLFLNNLSSIESRIQSIINFL